MYKKIILILGLIFTVFAGIAFAEAKVPVKCTGESIIYNKEERTISGKGNVEVSYKDSYLRADKAVVNIDTKDVNAEGNVVISDGTNIYTGSKLHYNMNTGKGTVDGIMTSFWPWFAKGDYGNRISKDVYYVKNGYITTCSYEKPHYKIKAKDIYIYPKDKVVAKDIIFYWGDVPLFYWPRYTKSLKDKRSPWTVVPGRDSKLGAFLLIGYSMWWDNFLGGKFEPTVRTDWYEKRGLGTGVSGKYSYKDKIRSFIQSYVINDKAYKKNGKEETKLRGRFSIDWVQRIKQDIRAIVKISKLSDKKIVYDFSRDEFYDNIQRENYIDISKTTSSYQLDFILKGRLNNFYNVLERLPDLSLHILQRRIGNTRFLYQGSARAGYLRKQFADSSTSEDYDSFRFDTTHQIWYPKKYFGWLNIIPSAGTRQTYYNKGAELETKALPNGKASKIKKQISKDIIRSVYFAGVEFTTKICRIFNIDNSFWQIHQLRHVIEPRIDYVYKHRPTVSQDELLDFGENEARANYIGLSVRNKLQTRRGDTTWNLVDLLLSTNYYPQKFEENGAKRDFSHILGDLELRPFDWISIDMDIDFDQYDKQIDTYNTDFVMYKGDKLSLGIGYRYAQNSDKLWSSEINYIINSDWALRMRHRFKFDTGQLEEQEYIIFRDLHCWKLAVSFREYRRRDEKAVFIVLYPKAYPQFPFTFGTTFLGRNNTNNVRFTAD